MLRQSQSFQSYNPIGQLSPKHHFDAYHHHHHHQSSSLNYNFPSSQHSKSHNFNTHQELNSSPSTSLASSASWMNRLNEKTKHHSYGDQDQTIAHYSETSKGVGEMNDNQNSINNPSGDETPNEQSMKMVFKQENISKSDYYDTKSTASSFSVENNCSLESERNRDNSSNLLPKDDNKYLSPYGSPIKKSHSEHSKTAEHSDKSLRTSNDFADNLKKEHQDDKEYHNFSHYQSPPATQLDINSKPLRYPQDTQQSDYFYNFPYNELQQQQQLHNQTTNSSSSLIQSQNSFLPPQPASTPFQPYNMYSPKSSTAQHNLTNFEQKIPLHKYPTGKQHSDRIDDENCKLPTSKWIFFNKKKRNFINFWLKFTDENFPPSLEKSSVVNYEGAKESSARDQSPNPMIRQSEPVRIVKWKFWLKFYL